MTLAQLRRQVLLAKKSWKTYPNWMKVALAPAELKKEKNETI